MALGFFGALLMGFVLGVLGGGGAILTIPILVYLFGFDLRSAVVSSYAILFFSSIVGGIQSRKEIEWRLAFLFAAVSAVFIALTKFFLLPILPKEILLFGLKISTQSILNKNIKRTTNEIIPNPIQKYSIKPYSVVCFPNIRITAFAIFNIIKIFKIRYWFFSPSLILIEFSDSFNFIFIPFSVFLANVVQRSRV